MGGKKMSNKLTPISHSEFDEMISIIERSRENAFRAVNQELLLMYWEISTYISDKVRNDNWRKPLIDDFAKFIKVVRLDSKGFSASNVCLSSGKPKSSV